MKAVSKPSRVAAAVVVAAVFFALWYPGFAYDYTVTNAWSSATVSMISTLQVGQVVKVQGTILSDSPVAFGGYEVLRGGAWDWDWNTGDVFSLYDSSGSITVSTADWYIVYNGPEAAPNAYHVQVGVYGPGDIVQIVGTVVRATSGGLQLDMQIMAQSYYLPVISITPSPLTASLFWLLPLTIVGVLGTGTAIFLWRREVHRAATKSDPRYSVATTDTIRSPDLKWQPNGRGTNPAKRKRWAAVFVLAGIGLLAVYPGFGPRTWWGLFSLGFIGTIVLMFETAVVYMLLFGGAGHPAYVSVAEDGYHMWFESPYDQHLNDTIFPWDQIQDIHMTGGKGAHWVLRWTTGESTNLYMLNGANLQQLIEEWTRRKMTGSP